MTTTAQCQSQVDLTYYLDGIYNPSYKVRCELPDGHEGAHRLDRRRVSGVQQRQYHRRLNHIAAVRILWAHDTTTSRVK